MRRLTLALVCLIALALGFAAPAVSSTRTTDRDVEQAPVSPGPTSAPELERVGGTDRYETAELLSQDWAPGTTTVFVVSGQDYPDALVAAARAGLVDSPVLLTRTKSLPNRTAEALSRLAPSEIVVVGGPAAVSDTVLTSLSPYAGSVHRIYGSDRYETAAQLADAYPSHPERVYLASGADFPDALAAAALAGSRDEALLLTPADQLPGAVAAQLDRLAPDQVVVVGGASAVSDSVAAEAAQLSLSGTYLRISGASRYDTAALVANEFDDPSRVYLSSGETFSDALVAAAAAARDDAPVLTTRQEELPTPTAAGLIAATPADVRVIGGPAAVSDDVVAAVASLDWGGDESGPPAVPDPDSSVGAAPIGTTNYPVPDDAIFVQPAGDESGSGTEGSPYGSLQHAINNAPSGSTLVLREGRYHESVRVPFHRELTIQPYPYEAVWLDGSEVVAGWQSSGSRWFVEGWEYDFDSRVSFNPGLDESHRFVDPSFPMAGYPDMVWIDNEPLTQVGSLNQVADGTFFVDKVDERLYLGTDPIGSTVHASTIQKGMQIHGEGTTVRGIGIQRYATTLHMMGAISAEVHNLTLENLVIRDNATVGLYGWNNGQTFNRLTVERNGMMGIGHNSSENLVISNSVVNSNNVERFKPAPASGGLKLTNAFNLAVTDNYIADNINSGGLWLDVNTYNVQVAGNVIVGNGETGIMFELSDTAVIANNYVVENKVGIWVYASSNVEVWNNTLVYNDRTLAVWDDGRTQPNPDLKDLIPWETDNVNVHNNALAYGSNFCPVLTQDLAEEKYGNEFGLTMNGNVYHRTSTADPERFVCWANGPHGTMAFRSLAEFRAGTGNETQAHAAVGEPILDAQWQLAPEVKELEPTVALALPASIATVIGESPGLRRLGAVSHPSP